MTKRAWTAALLLAAGVLAGCGGKQEADGREVVLYCSVDQELARQIIREYERRSGVRVLARFDTEASKTVGLVQRIRAEAGDPAADVFWSGEVFHTIRLAGEGLLAEYPGGPADWPAGLADGQGRWYGFALRARVIAYHTGRVAAEEAPRTLEDVLDGRWAGRVVMARPEFGTTGGDVASWFVHYGPARATEILRALKANGVRLVDGNSTAVRMVATGQADVCFTDTDDVYAAQRNGWPVAMNPLDQGGAGALAIPNTAAILKGAPHEKEARELMAFLLSEDVERLLAASESHNTPVRAKLPADLARHAIGRRLEVDYARVAEQLPSALRAAMEILP